MAANATPSRPRTDKSPARSAGNCGGRGAGGLAAGSGRSAAGGAETLAAVLHVLATCGDDVDGAMRYAIGLGGDTDTVAAITGGILGCRSAKGEERMARPGHLAGHCGIGPARGRAA